MAFEICYRQTIALPREIDCRQAARLFGARWEDAAADALLHRLAPEILAAAVPRVVWAEFSLADSTAQTLLSGEDITAHLAGCDTFFLLGMTLGSGVDAAIRRLAVGDVAAQVAADALAGALAEQVCDEAEKSLRTECESKGRYLTGRFSPGYGDWPITEQKQIGRLLELPKQIGVSVTETCLMLPRKSVTAVLGASDHPVTGKRAGCAHCALRGECEYRKRGQSCENNGTVSST